MTETQLHPFDSESTAVATTSMATSPGPLSSGGITFQEATMNKEATSSAPPDSSVKRTTSILRNRIDPKQPIVTSPQPEASVQLQGNTTSNASSSGTPKPALSRRVSGPGGRFEPDEDDDGPPRCTTRVSDFFQKLYSQYSPSLTLENKGSIARDHLANERTYLAWLRTSLSLITVGVAVTQLFRLQASASGQQSNELKKVSQLGRPLGGTFIALGILFLWLGTSRYFHNQSVLSYGQFPASRGSVVLATVTTLAILLACFIIVVLQDRT
ncbi:hypothetical protein BGX29_001639 [Mortierella sp. GBA35]|nr:hypothetical protein BGX29_001639 [Mortierella sp. GBA35]